METATESDVRALIRGLTDGLWVDASYQGHGKYIGISDELLVLPTREQVEEFLNFNRVHLNSSGQFSDCDKFSKLLVSQSVKWIDKDPEADVYWCFGTAWGEFSWMDGFHACNFFIDDQRNLWWVEPQDNSIHHLSECTGNLTLMVV